MVSKMRNVRYALLLPALATAALLQGCVVEPRQHVASSEAATAAAQPAQHAQPAQQTAAPRAEPAPKSQAAPAHAATAPAQPIVVVQQATPEPPIRVVYVKAPPPPPKPELIPPPPGREFVWVAGHMQWTGHRYTWMSGSWLRRPAHAIAWIDGRWHHTAHGWAWLDGHWQLPGAAQGQSAVSNDFVTHGVHED